MNTLAFIGAGHLADYTVRGLRRGGFRGRIVLSPRNKDVAAALATDCGCEIAASNRAAADAADTVIVSVRPLLVEKVLGELTLRNDQTLLSVVAGFSLTKLSKLAPNAKAVVRALPVTCAEVCASPTLICPPNKEVEALFEITGTAVPVDSEAEFESAAVMTCIYTSFFALFDSLIAKTEAAGVAPAAARTLVAGMAKGAAVTAAEDPASLSEITNKIATPGTYSLIGLETIRDRDGFAAWEEAFDRVLEHLQSSPH